MRLLSEGLHLTFSAPQLIRGWLLFKVGELVWKMSGHDPRSFAKYKPPKPSFRSDVYCVNEACSSSFNFRCVNEEILHIMHQFKRQASLYVWLYRYIFRWGFSSLSCTTSPLSCATSIAMKRCTCPTSTRLWMGCPPSRQNTFTCCLSMRT